MIRVPSLVATVTKDWAKGILGMGWDGGGGDAAMTIRGW